MKNKNLVLLMSVILVICLVFSACSKEKEPDSKVDGNNHTDNGDGTGLTPDNNKIVVWLHSNSPEDPQVNEFARIYPDYVVDNSVAVKNPFLHVDYDLELQRLGAAIASNDQPDLFLGYMTPLEAFYSNLFMPVQEYLEKDPVYNFDTIQPNVLNGTTFNNQVYFIPTAYDVPVLIWNKDLFEEVGLDPEQPPKTWKELEEYNKKLVTYDTEGNLKSVGTFILDWQNYCLINTGRQYSDETGLKLDLDNNDFNDAVEYIRSLPDHYGGYQMLPENGLSFFNSNVGISCMISNGAIALSQWVNGNFRFGIGLLPAAEGMDEYYLYSNCSNLLCIPKKARNPKGGWLYIKYRMTDATYVEAVDAYNKTPRCCIVSYITHIPTREKLYKDFETTFTEESWELIKARDAIIEKANVPAYTTVEHIKFYNYLADEFEKVMNYEISSKEFLANAQSFGESLIRSFKERKTAEKWVFHDDGTVEIPQEE